ncbi:hypothetical protein STEG23_014352, partial [Scotinomys teguina]
ISHTYIPGQYQLLQNCALTPHEEKKINMRSHSNKWAIFTDSEDAEELGNEGEGCGNKVTEGDFND